VWITTRDQSRDIDLRATQEFGIPSTELMEAAGQAVTELAQSLLLDQATVSILCGPGNNGGDGLVVARMLHKLGYKVTILITSSEENLKSSTKDQLKKIRYLKLDPLFPQNPNFQLALQRLNTHDLIIDALLGTGSEGAPRDPISGVITAANQSQTPIISIDIPSGIDCDSGVAHAQFIRANHTITIGNPKPFLFQNAGLEASGKWNVAPINFPPELLNQPTDFEYITEFPILPQRAKNSHKGTSGRLLIVAGSDNMPGAAILAAHAALCAGIGLVTLASTPEVCRVASHHLPEIILHPLLATDGVIASSAANDLIASQSIFDAAIFGPGLSTHPETLSFLKEVFSNLQIPSVIDADGLNAGAKGVRLPPSPCVLTPHPGELARLMCTTTDEIQLNRFEFAQQAVENFNQTILLKGAHSIVATPSHPLAVNSSGNPGMATGGMGDALSGIIGTLLAQGHPPRESAIAGMFWHGLAADLCAHEIGSVGYTATDLIRNLPRTRAKLTAS